MTHRAGTIRTIMRAYLALLLLLPVSIGSTFGTPKTQPVTVVEETGGRLVQAGGPEARHRLAQRFADLVGSLGDPDDDPDPLYLVDTGWPSGPALGVAPVSGDLHPHAQRIARAHRPRAPPQA